MTQARKNPFPVTGYWGPRYFCDREHEIDVLTEALQNGRHTVVLSIRRLGKSALIWHLFNRISRKNAICLYCDLQATSNQKQLINELATAIWRAAPEKTSWGRQLMNFIKSLRPVISYNDLTGQPEITLAMASAEQEKNSMEQLLSHLDNQKLPVYFAFDEFQQITAYPETHTEAFLRKIIQDLQNVTFLFIGSEQHILADIFGSAKRPFFGMTQMLKLNRITAQAYGGFIKKKFKNSDWILKQDALDFILTWTRRHTYYTQMLCNRVFSSDTDPTITLNSVRAIADQILREQTPLFITYRNMLTAHQWRLLAAIAVEQELYSPTAGGFINQYRLGGTSSVKRALDALLEKELIFRDLDPDNKPYYGVYDVFLSRWLEQNYKP